MSKKSARSDGKDRISSNGGDYGRPKSVRKKIVFTVCNPTGMPAPVPKIAGRIQMPPAIGYGMVNQPPTYLPREEDEDEDY